MSSYHPTDHGYLEHWRRVGPLLEQNRRDELRRQGAEPTDWQIIDSLLQLGYLHGNRNPKTGLIQWQARLAKAHRNRSKTAEPQDDT